MNRKFLLLLLWAGTLCAAFYLGHINHRGNKTSDAAKSVDPVTILESAARPDESNNIESRRIPGPIKLSLEEMLNSEDLGSYTYQFGLLLEALDADTLPLFLDELEALPHTKRREEFLSKLMARWGELDPQAAAAYMDTYPGRIKGQLIAAIAKSWARNDPQAAWDYVISETRGGRKYHVSLHSVFQAAFETDPKLAVSLVSQVESETRRSSLYSWLGAAVADKGHFKSAMNVIDSMAPSEEKDSAVKGILEEWAEADLTSAIDYFNAMEHGPEREKALKSIMFGWASKDPQAALSYCLEEVEEADRGPALKEVIKGWANAGRLMEAAAYLLELPVSKETDEAVNGILYQMSMENPVTAVGWANSLQNEEQKQSALRTAVSYWASEDFESAQKFVMEMSPGEDRDRNIGALVYSQSSDGEIADSVIPMIERMEEQDTRERYIMSLANQAIYESSYSPNVTEENKLRVIEQIGTMEGISEEIRSRAISLIKGDPPKG